MSRFKPDLILESVLHINLQALKKRGIRAFLVDIDNTLVRWQQTEMETIFIDWIRKAQEQGFRFCLISNAMGRRAQSFAALLGIPAVGRACKPFNRAFLRGLTLLQAQVGETAVIGDQVFTDIFGGNRLGLYTILINPLSREELLTTKLMRRLERRVLASLARRQKIQAHHLAVREKRDGQNDEKGAIQ